MSEPASMTCPIEFISCETIDRALFNRSVKEEIGRSGCFFCTFTETEAGSDDVNTHNEIPITRASNLSRPVDKRDRAYLVCVFRLSGPTSHIWDGHEVFANRIIGGANG